MTEMVVHQSNTSIELAQDVEYAKLVSAGAMLPQQYRGKPADILIAIGLGRAMGLSAAESLYRINVIQGRPTASAELVAANVRRAGHVLRVKGDETQARAVIIRSDDPDFEFESVWNLDRAKQMGLLDKDGWKKQPGTMMRWRAVTEVARLACPEALYGVAYVREEIEDDNPAPAPTQRVSAADFMASAAPAAEPAVEGEVITEETGDRPASSEPSSRSSALPKGPPTDPKKNHLAVMITEPQRRAMFAAFTAAGFGSDARSAEGRAARLGYIGQVLGRDVDSTGDLTKAEASTVLEALASDAQEASLAVEGQ